MRSCGLMQKLIKFNLAHEGTMMRFCEFLSNEIIFHCQILAEQLISAIEDNSQTFSKSKRIFWGIVIHTAWIGIWMTKRPGATSDSGFILTLSEPGGAHISPPLWWSSAVLWGMQIWTPNFLTISVRISLKS